MLEDERDNYSLSHLWSPVMLHLITWRQWRAQGLVAYAPSPPSALLGSWPTKRNFTLKTVSDSEFGSICEYLKKIFFPKRKEATKLTFQVST